MEDHEKAFSSLWSQHPVANGQVLNCLRDANQYTSFHAMFEESLDFTLWR